MAFYRRTIYRARMDSPNSSHTVVVELRQDYVARVSVMLVLAATGFAFALPHHLIGYASVAALIAISLTVWTRRQQRVGHDELIALPADAATESVTRTVARTILELWVPELIVLSGIAYAPGAIGGRRGSRHYRARTLEAGLHC